MGGTCSYSSNGGSGAVFLGSNYACCNETAVFTQDQVCADFTIPAGTTPGTTFSIFAMNLGTKVFSSGYIEDTTAVGTTPDISAIFLSNGATIGGPFNSGVTIPSGGSLTFTATKFDSIGILTRVTPTIDITGKVCVTPRYQLS